MFRMISYAWRAWRSAKAPALLAIAALAAGIGCATTIFSVVYPVLLKPLPYRDSNRWVAIFGASTLTSEASQFSALSVADLTDYQQRCRSFDVFGWFTISQGYNLTSPGQPEHIAGVQVTPSLVNNVGINPILGNLFRDSDGSHVTLISSRLWKQLGADPAIIGKPITLDGEIYTVSGVMPSWFQLPIVSVAAEDEHNDIWIPFNPPVNESDRHRRAEYAGYARLRPGVSIEQATADAKRVAIEIVQENPGRAATYTATLFGLQQFVSQAVRPFLLLFLVAACLLLLVACANVAGLLVARSVSRAQEIAVRVALGASKSDLVRQFFLEASLLSMIAAVLGVLASIGLTRLVLALAADYIPRSNEITVNGPAVVFAIVLGCVTAILPALAPLRQAVHTQPNEVLSSGVRSSAGTRSRRLSQSLVTAEIALAFLLLSSSGVLIAELNSLRHTWPGFDASHLLTFEMNSDASFASNKEYAAYQGRLLTSLEQVPGVSSAALTNQVPLEGCCLSAMFMPYAQPANFDYSASVSLMVVSPNYFSTLKIPLKKGRLLTDQDNRDDPTPIVLDEAAAKLYWSGKDPLDQFLLAGGPNGQRLQVVGVVGNVLNQGLGSETRPEVYLLNTDIRVNPMNFIVRSSLPPAALMSMVRESMHRADPNHPVYGMQMIEQIVQGSVFLQQFDSLVVALFAFAALLMTSLGIYSVTSYWVRERTVEIGTRMALGAQRGDLLGLVVGGAWKMTAYGMLIGIAGSVAAILLVMQSLSLHHIGVLPYVGSVLIVGTIATGASFFPALRATLLSPMIAIRNESDPFWASGRRRLEDHISRHREQNDTSEVAPAMLADFIEASRRADSFAEAIAISLSELRETIKANFVVLFELTTATSTQYRCRTAVPLDAHAAAIPLDGFLTRRLRFYSAPLAFGASDMETALRWATEQSPGYVTEIEQLKTMGVRLVVALRRRNETIGLLLLGAPQDRKRFSSADKRLVQTCAQELALVIENARLTDRVIEQEKLRRDVALAAEVQGRLLPQKAFENESSSVAAFMLPARGGGGDCFDFLELDNGEVGIALADVAGKGVAAALIMAVIQASLRIITSENSVSPPALAAKMNHFLFQSTGSSSYATFFYAQWHPQEGKLHYVNAGHNPPFLVRVREVAGNNSGSHTDVEELATGGAIIGMFPALSYEEGVAILRSGDVVFAFTDGVSEAHNPNDEEFGEGPLKDLVCRVSHLPVQQIISAVSQELRNWIADAPQYDDLTFIVLKIK